MTPPRRLNEETTANILAFAKAISPDRVPTPSEQTTRAWTATLSQVRLPQEIWYEAVQHWALNLAGPRMITPRELKESAEAVWSQWQTDPEKIPIIEAFRKQLDAERAHRRETLAIEARRKDAKRAQRTPIPTKLRAKTPRHTPPHTTT